MGETVSLRFLGAAATVTGSRFLVIGGSDRVLVDCGMHQGQRGLRRHNWEPFPASAEEMDAVVLSHAHLDHCVQHAPCPVVIVQSPDEDRSRM